MRQKIEKMSHKSEKSGQDPPITIETWVAMERKAQAAKASHSKQTQAEASKSKQKQAIELARV